jgi:hypothetical protein
VAAAEKDWIEVLAKALLPRPMRRWVRRQRTKALVRRHHRRDLALFRGHLRPTDVFLVGHPKSGNTWLAYMLAIIIYQDKLHQVRDANLKGYTGDIHGNDTRIMNYRGLRDPRIFRNECPVYPELYPRTIYLLRDPRAVIVSLYHMYRIMVKDSQKTLGSFIEDYLGGQGCFTTWYSNLPRWDVHVISWMKRAEQDHRVLVVRYEDLVANRRGVLEKVVGFAGIPCTEEDLALAVTRGSFEAMRGEEEKHGSHLLSQAYPGERGWFVRRGEADGWRQELDDRMARRIETELAHAMRATGYPSSP